MRHSSLLMAALACFLPAAAGFGYVPPDTSQSVQPGEQARFTLPVFGEQGTVQVVTQAAPEGWLVDATPHSVELPATGDIRYIRRGDGYTAVRPVRIRVAVPPDAAPGRYTVRIVARQTAPDTGGATVTVRQEQNFVFTVAVAGKTETDTDGANERPDRSGDGDGLTIAAPDNRSNSSTARDGSTEGLPLPLILFELAWVAVIAYLVWRR